MILEAFVGVEAAETKLETLDFLFAKFGQLDNGGGRTLDLRGDVVTQLSAPQVAAGDGASLEPRGQN